LVAASALAIDSVDGHRSRPSPVMRFATLAIVFVRLPFGVRRYPLEASAGVSLANG